MDRHFQHACRIRDRQRNRYRRRHARYARSRNHQTVGVRIHADHELLSHRHLRRPIRRMAYRIRQRRRPHRADGHVLPSGARRSVRQGCRLPVRHHQEGFCLLCEDLGRAVSVRQVRPDLRAGIQCRRYGEHWHGHYPRPVRVRIEGHRRVCRASCRHRATRACTHVVRRLRDHEVVERPVA